MPARKPAQAKQALRRIVEAAFHRVREGYPPDRVAADPELNSRFLGEARRLGATQSASELNRQLINLRKTGRLPNLRSTRTTFRDQAEYLFACEMAVRFLERRDGVTLDEIICDPDRAAEFDQIAAQLVPGHTSLQYRWGALSLRKNRRLRPEPIGRAIQPISVVQERADQIDLGNVPTTQGLYIFFAGSECLYVGEAQNLRSRLKKHLDHSDNRGLGRWLWQHGGHALYVEWQVLPPATRAQTRRAMECELIRSRRPLFNVVYSQKQSRVGGAGADR